MSRQDPPKDDHAVCEQDGFGDAVRHDDERHRPTLPQSLELQVEALARERVERAERLVEQQHRRPPHERTCEAGLLRHPARQLGRERALEAAEADEVQGRARLRLAFVARYRSSRGNATFEIVSRHGSRRGSWKTSPTHRSGPSTGPRERRSPRRATAGGHDAQQRALARPVRTEDRNELPLPDDEVDGLRGDEARARKRERERHATQLDRRRPHRRGRHRLALSSLVQRPVPPACRRAREGSDALAPSALGSTHLGRARGRRRAPSGVASSLLPSGLLPSAPCRGTTVTSVTGRGLATVPGTPPTTGRSFPNPEGEARIRVAPMIRRVASSEDGPPAVDRDGWAGTLDSLHIGSVWGILCDP